MGEHGLRNSDADISFLRFARVFTDRNGYIMISVSDYETALGSLGVALFAVVLLSSALLEIYLPSSSVRDLQAIASRRLALTDFYLGSQTSV